MIQLTRLNGSRMVLNSDLIEHAESTPDTVVTLTTGQKLLVKESPEAIIDLVVRFRRAIHAESSSLTDAAVVEDR